MDSRNTKDLLLASIALIDRDIKTLEDKTAKALSEEECLKLCRYATVLNRLIKVEELNTDPFLEVKADKLNKMIDELVVEQLNERLKTKDLETESLDGRLTN